MPRWMGWRADNKRGVRTKVFTGEVSNATIDIEVGAGSWAELYVATHDDKETEVVVRPFDGSGVVARRTMPDTPEELLAWYRAVIRLHRPN